MKRYGKTVWKAAPFFRLLPALIAGILLQYYCNPLLMVPCVIIPLAAGILGWLRLLSMYNRYRLNWLNGIAVYLLVSCAGMAVVYNSDITHRSNWIGHQHHQKTMILVSVEEPLTEKKKSFKALAKIRFVKPGAPDLNGEWRTASGYVLLYFRKDSGIILPDYGSQLVINKPLQAIVNRNDKDAFDYQRYCAFQGIYHQVLLQQGDYRIVLPANKSRFATALITAQQFVVTTLQKKITGDKEAGIAAALLIGYKNGLDKDLLQAYSNTGVVHIIAISGMHLGMIYGLLVALLRPLRNRKGGRWIKPLVILAVLWGFSFLAGAVPSILRSAVMFSFIVVGEAMGKRTNIYNTLAASAFCLLLYNPYYLWDTGFQLSYTAVLSIVIFMNPVYKCLYFKNKLLSIAWQLNAVTLSAQILTFPLLLYYFHQFPNLFLFTNFFVVPLSGFILYGCLVLLGVAEIPVLGALTGKDISWLIMQMNGLIGRTDSMPFSVTGGMQITCMQCLLLYGCIGCFGWWLLQKQVRGLLAGMGSLVLFLLIRCIGLAQ
jgi:competence protein ComEC